MFAKLLRTTLVAGVFAALAATASVAQTPMGPAMTAVSPLGTILVAPNGMTLYTWDRDTEANVSTCYNQCAVNWPIFAPEAGATASGDWTIVQRTDGTSIWAYMGKPLYFFINDTAAGQTNGNQPDGTWHVVVIP